MSEMSALATAGMGLGGAILLLIYASFFSVAPTEMGLVYNYVLKTVDRNPIVVPGLSCLGPFRSMLKYPKTIQTIEYSQYERDLLDGRTSDGLPLTLGVAFQYRLLPDKLYDLYRTFENQPGDYLHVYKLMAIHIITEEATNFSAYEFFNDKQRIATKMRMKLDAYFQANMFASVESLQINEDELPPVFTDTILEAATSKQNITKMGKTKLAKVIEFGTAVVVAEAQANVTIQNAVGDRHRILQNGNADAAIIEAYVTAQTEAYAKIHDELGLHGDSLLKYIWYDTLSGGSVSADARNEADVQMLIGVNPAAYISEK